METNVTPVSVEDYMHRFCTNLNLNISVQEMARNVAKCALNLNMVTGRSPISVAAASIYMAVTTLGLRKEKKGPFYFQLFIIYRVEP